jgi:4-hydroxy-tetrahydrodipicolinate synthase
MDKPVTDPAGSQPPASNGQPVEGLLPVIPTPFLDGRLDERSLGRFLDHFLPWLDGYTLLGSSGEAPSLSTQERMRIAEVAMSLTPPGKTVVVGVTHTSLADTIALARHAGSIGARGVLCAVPYYFANTAAGVLRYLQGLDETLDTELVLYDNPAPSGFRIPAQLACEWADQLAHLHTVKLTEHDLSKIPLWHQAGLKVLAGDDPIAFRFLAAGADGAMMIAPCIFPEAFLAVWDLVRDREVSAAYEVFAARILPLVHVFGIGDEIATSKAVLQEIGLFTSAEVLPPLEPAAPDRSALVRLGYRLAERGTAASASTRPETGASEEAAVT